MSFDEQGEKFRRVAQTRHGPMYVERHEAPMLPPKRHPYLSWLWGVIVQALLLIGGVLVLIIWWNDERANWALPIVGGVALTLFLIACDWAHGRGGDD